MWGGRRGAVWKAGCKHGHWGSWGSRDRKVFGKWEMTPVKEWLPQQKACGTGGVMRAGRAGPRMG